MENNKEKVVPYKKYLEVYKGMTFEQAYSRFLICDLFYKYGLSQEFSTSSKTPRKCKDQEGNEFILLFSAETHKRHKPNRGPGKKHYFYYQFIPLSNWIGLKWEGIQERRYFKLFNKEQ